MNNNTDLTKEQELFLSALSDYINEKTTTLPPDADIPALIGLSNNQQLSPIVFYQTGIPELQPAVAAASYYALNRRRHLESIGRLFSSAGIRYLVFKGEELARYYRHPYLRTAGDIDIMVDPSEKEKAGELLESLGFRAPDSKGTDHEWCYYRGDYEIELHHRLLYDSEMNDSALTAFTDTAWEHAATGDGVRCSLEPEFHFVFLLLHLRKHFLWAGVGIRQLLDIAVMAKNGDLNWSKVGEYIERCGIQPFSSVCFTLISRWFGVSVPLPSAPVTREFYCRATNTVLSDSAFGDMSDTNLVENSIFNTVQKHGKLRSALAIVFPPLSQMSRKYPILSKHAFLLPFFWLRRMVEALFKRSAGSGLSYASRHMKGNRERTEELKQWGLK